MSVIIITDSASDMAAVPGSGLLILPMTITFGTEQFQDGVTLSHREFYGKLIEGDIIPTTSQISPYEFETAFKKVADAGDTAVAVILSSKLSGTYQSAVMAVEEYKDSVILVDSENVSVGERILVEYALRLRDAGRTASEIAEKVEEKKKDVCMIALLDTLEYLKKGGRVSKAAAFAGGILSIKPVLSVEDGEVLILGKARGSRQGSNMLVETIRQKGGIDFGMPVMLGYTGLDDSLLQKYIEDSAFLWKDHLAKLPVGTIGGTIGTHAGPGAIAVAFFHK